MTAVLFDHERIVTDDEVATGDPANAPGEEVCIFLLSKPGGFGDLHSLRQCLATLG